tara:strand:- start:2443 stop:2967 length:525 start_codon:yes stop_codon:yes gene_type:complete
METFKKIKGFEGYEISNHGRVKSFKMYSVGKVLKGGVDDSGYKLVILNGKTKKIHKLVAIAFLNHKPDGHNEVVNHIDNNKLNNHLTNLNLKTQHDNTRCHKDSPNVAFRKRDNNFQVQMRFTNSKIFHLGYYNSKEDATKFSEKAYQLICEGITIEDWIQWINENSSRKRKIQ